MIKFIVYKTTNLVNNKFYVGVHKTNTPYEFDGYLGSGKVLQQAIKKYGKDNFERKTLVIFDIEEEAYELEKRLVNKSFMEREDTYNLCGGGCGVSIFSEESRKKISIANKGSCHSDEAKKKMSDNHWDCSGKNNPSYGKHHSEETKKKMSEVKKGENNPMFGKRGKDTSMFGKHHTETTRKLMSKNHRDNSGENHPMFGKTGENNPNFGKHRTEETKRKMSESSRLAPEIIRQRLLDIKNEPKIYGWKANLGRKWDLDRSTAGKFIRKHAND